MTIALAMIVRDAAATLEACVRSARPFVDRVAVCDTGSRDGTLELVAGLAAEPGPPIVVERGEWRDDFGWARERSFELAGEAEWLLWLDADDELVGGENLPALVAAAERARADVMLVDYDYGVDAAGVCFSRTLRERIVRAGAGWRWRGRVHEELCLYRRPRHARASRDALHVVHRRDPAAFGDRDRVRLYRRLLELDRAEEVLTRGRPSLRTLLYLGELPLTVGDVEAAVPHLAGYLVHPDSVRGSDERQHVTVCLAHCERSRGNPGRALELLLGALAERADWPQTHGELAELHAAAGRWAEVELHARAAVTLARPETFVNYNPLELDVCPRVRLFQSLWHQGRRGEAGLWLAEARALAPGLELDADRIIAAGGRERAATVGAAR